MKIKDLRKQLDQYADETEIIVNLERKDEKEDYYYTALKPDNVEESGGEDGEIQLNVSLDNQVEGIEKMKCKNCGKENGSNEEDLLCEECRMTFGHALFSEL